MREYLFKGKRKDNEEWVEGKSINTQKDVNGKEHVYIGLPVKSDTFPKMITVEWVEVIPETVGRYTGLTDKNGTKIFEGDIVKHHFGNEYGVVKFGEYSQPFNDDKFTKHIGFYIDWITGKCKHILRKDLGFWANIKEYDIFVGTIHDNPELLEVGKNG